MSKAVHYSPKDASHSYTVYIKDVDAYKKWHEDDDTSIPLVEFLDSFEIWRSETGQQGKLRRPSKQELSIDFETEKEDVAIERLLLNEKARLKPTKDFQNGIQAKDSKSS